MVTETQCYWIEREEGVLIDGHAYDTLEEAREEALSYVENDEGPLFIVKPTRNGTVTIIEIVG